MALVEFQNNTAPYLNAENLNNNFNYLDEKAQDIYSTNEIVIGKWINGESIYRKVISSYGVTGNNVIIPHNITDFKQLVNYSLIAGDNGLSYVNNNSLYDFYVNTVDTSNVNMVIAGAYLNWQIYIVLDYIKTTDEGDE